jgi:N-acetylglucosamine-6-phosphate deacetylase
MSSPKQGQICARHYATGQPMRVRWKAGRITQLEPADATSAPETWIAPGLVDLQINGYGGIDFQQDNLTLEDLLSATRQMRAAGATRFLLTLITDEWDRLTSRLRHVRALRARSPELQSAIAGWHVEGPFLSAQPGFHGAHDPVLLLDPTPEHILELRSLSGSDPLLLTLAPERPGALQAIALAVSQGLKISLGHTDAPAEVLLKAVKAGATGFTHLGNGCPAKLDRHDNILWRVLETPGLQVSLIPDRVHVSPPLFRLLHRFLEPDSVYYTTDAMSAAGMPPSRYKLGKLDLDVGPDQIVRRPGTLLFAGAALRPVDGVFRAAQMLGCPWQTIWQRFSEAPAKRMGLWHGLAEGQPADFCLLRTAGENLLELRVGFSPG